MAVTPLCTQMLNDQGETWIVVLLCFVAVAGFLGMWLLFRHLNVVRDLQETITKRTCERDQIAERFEAVATDAVGSWREIQNEIYPRER